MVVRADSPDILKKIVEVKNREVRRLKSDVPIDDLVRRIDSQPDPLAFGNRLVGSRINVIAEVKRASPSRGVLRENLDPSWVATRYVENGAAAVSVLTNRDHFHGSLEDLEAVATVAHAASIPVLRKEFIFDPYQVHEARAYGADAILLIVSMLNRAQLESLKELAESYGMETLVEVHDEEELAEAVAVGYKIIGINNRNLRTFHTTLDITLTLGPLVPEDCVLVSESGMKSVDDLKLVADAGASAVLIGDALVTAPDPGAKLKELLG
jgi:indole-3-glycerol phosphate synthase